MRESAHVLNLFSLLFGIRLSFAALLTGIALGVGSRWGVFRSLIAAATYDVIALIAATALSVFKPGRAVRHSAHG